MIILHIFICIFNIYLYFEKKKTIMRIIRCFQTLFFNVIVIFTQYQYTQYILILIYGIQINLRLFFQSLLKTDTIQFFSQIIFIRSTCSNYDQVSNTRCDSHVEQSPYILQQSANCALSYQKRVGVAKIKKVMNL